jgi:hypothetical protein
MSLPAWLRSLLTLIGFSLLVAQANADTTLEAAASAPSGSSVKVSWTGPVADYDAIIIVPVAAPDSERPSRNSTYTYGKSPIQVLSPEPPGEYEVRFIQGRTKQVLARRSLAITPVTATLQGPASVVGGNSVNVDVTGPHNAYDKICILPAGAPDDAKNDKSSSYTYGHARVSVVAPEQPGEYELRYLRGQSGTTLARAKLSIIAATASVKGPGTAASGATIPVDVTGPGNAYDKVVVVPVGTPELTNPHRFSAYTYGKANVSVLIPEPPGQYEIRYLTGATNTTLARDTLTIGAASASIHGPGKAEAGSYIKVDWQGPGSTYDQIVAVPKGSEEHKWVSSGYVYKSSPMTLRAPLALGQYELRYLTEQSGTTLARDELEVVAAKQEPGLLRVTAGKSTLSAGGAVEIILDASGSMLQRIGSERRIDIAKQTLTHLTRNVIPAGTPFALRVFGREASSCQTDLDIPVRPLDAAAVAQKVASLEAKSGAKTPIAASLEKVASDLGSVKGERLVILVTDGEETCGGTPRRAIEKLRKGGVSVRVNIVGFAVEDSQLAASFRQWSMAGNGSYFDARDAQGLKDALAAAVGAAYEVRNAQKQVVAEGQAGDEPVRLMPGTYTVHLKGQKGRSQRITVRSKETAAVKF